MLGKGFDPISGRRIGVTSKDKFFCGIKEFDGKAIVGREIQIGASFNQLDRNLVQGLQFLFMWFVSVDNLALNPQRRLFARFAGLYQGCQNFFPDLPHLGTTMLFNPSIGNQRGIGIDRTLKVRLGRCFHRHIAVVLLAVVTVTVGKKLRLCDLIKGIGRGSCRISIGSSGVLISSSFGRVYRSLGNYTRA